MTDETGRRILVVFDASSQSQAALDAAMKLMAGQAAELVGLFVEDINLFHMSALPCAIEVLFPAAKEQQPDLVRLERELRVRAQEVQRTLGGLAERAQVPWSFQVVRGNVTAALLSAAADVDWILLGCGSLERHRNAITRKLADEKRKGRLAG